uniref:CSON009920 protein n=1 Tax=Culicoides sonorensis TaxID=179676 RepID=A0A336M6K1_CULSO
MFQSSELGAHQQVNLNWCEFHQKNKPQGNAVVTEIMLGFASGIILSTIIYNADLNNEEWINGHSNVFIVLSGVSFFVGAIIGALLASYAVKRWFKKHIKHFPIILFYITGILFVSLPTNGSVIMVARLFGGIGMGFSHLVFIVHGSEVSVPKQRGMLLSTYSIMISTGLVIGSSFMMTTQYTGLSDARSLGIFILFYTAMGHVFLYVFIIESPVYLLQHGDVIGATQAMIKLRNESVETWDIRNDVSEFKVMLTEDSQYDKNIWSEGNSRPLLILIAAKLIYVLIFNYPLNVIRINAVNGMFFSDQLQSAGVILSATRLFITTIVLFAIDYFGRRFHLLYGAVSAGALSILISIFLFLYNVHEGGLLPAAIFSLFFETLPVFALCVPDILAGEAFPIIKKPQSISLVLIFEYVLQAILLVSTYGLLKNIVPEPDDDIGNFHVIPLILGIFILIATYICYKFVPETTYLSIRETKNIFRGTPQNVMAGIWYSG